MSNDNYAKNIQYNCDNDTANYMANVYVLYENGLARRMVYT